MLKAAVFRMVDLLPPSHLPRVVNVPPIGLGNRTKAAALLTSLLRVSLLLNVTMDGFGLKQPTVAAHPVNLLPLATTIPLPSQMAVIMAEMEAIISARLTKSVRTVLVPLVFALKVWMRAPCLV
jgi:hypothetical protein